MTTEPEAIPAEVRELARRLADENELSLFNEDLIAHAIMADRASRAPVDGAEAKPGWLPPETAPKDGTMLRLLIRVGTGENDGWTPFSDSSAPYETIGFNALADTLEDEWQFAGWDWCHDCFTDGAGEVIGWLPFGPHPAPSSPKCSQCDFGLGGHEPSCPNAPASPDAEMVERLTALTNSLRAAASRGPVTSREIFNLTDPIMDTLSKHEGPRS